MRPVSLSSKFFMWILLAATLPSTILTAIYLTSFKNTLIQHEIEQLSLMADNKVDQIENYIDEVIIDTRLLSHSLAAKTALKTLIPLYKNKNKELEQFLSKEATFKKYFYSFHHRGYYDIFLISLEGDIVLSLEHEIDFATNLITGPFKETGLSDVVKRAKLLLETNISSFDYYLPSNEFAAFVATPVLNEGEMLGILAIQIDSAIIQKIALDIGGSIKSRKVMIGTDTNEEYSFQVPIEASSDSKPGRLIPITQKTQGLMNAMRGIAKTVISTDHEGKQIIEASRFIPSLNWGLVLKEDLNEVMLSFNEMVKVSLFILALILLAVVVLAIYLARSVVKPLKILTKVTQAIAHGSDNLKVVPEGFKENYDLAESFNIMSDRLTVARKDLESKVEERTRKLRIANETLKSENNARIQAEKLLREREQNLAITLNSIADGVIVTDKEGLVTRMNPIAEQLTGWSFMDAKGLSLKKVFIIVNAITHQPILNPVEKVISTGKTVYLSNHTTLLSKTGEEYQISDSAAPIRNADNTMLGMVLVFNNVTEQYKLREIAAKSQKNLQGVLDHSPSIIYVRDLKGHYILTNKKFKQVFNLTDDNIIGKTNYDVFPKELAESFSQQDKVVIKTKRSLEIEETMLIEDQDNIFESIKYPLFNEEGDIYAICTISSDATQRKKIEEQLKRSQKMDAIGKLTGGIAHDYNNMLSVILGYAGMLEEALVGQSPLDKYAHEILHAGQRGAKLTQKLLNFSRKKSIDEEVLILNDLLLEQQHMLEKTLTVRVQLQFKLAESLWPVLLGGADFEDAMINLSINAMHAIEGNGQLIIQTRNEQIFETDKNTLKLDPGDYVVLSITDTGCGMSAETQEKIFEPFFSTKGEMGTGLGLSQVYGFVKRSRGVIKTYSELSKGTRFEIYIPRHYINDQTKQTKQTKQKSESKNITGNENILLVDDEIALLTLNSELLQNQGYQVFCAENAKQALEILDEETIDLLLTDIIMPKMNGYQLAAIVQKKYPDIKIQLASGFSDSQHTDITDDNLHRHLLNKPFNSHRLFQRIRILLDHKT